MGEHEKGRWLRYEGLQEEQEAYLWPEGIEERWDTTELERAHHRDKADSRGRTHQASTGEEIGRVGWLLAMGSNLKNRWFVTNGLMGKNLWSEYARQDWGRVKKEVEKVGREGLRERVPVGPKRAQGVQKEAMEILSEGGSEVVGKLERWADREGLLETPEAATPA